MDQPQSIDQFAAAFDTARQHFTAGINAEKDGRGWDSHYEFTTAENGFELAAKFTRNADELRKATRWAQSARRNAARYQPA